MITTHDPHGGETRLGESPLRRVPGPLSAPAAGELSESERRRRCLLINDQIGARFASLDAPMFVLREAITLYLVVALCEAGVIPAPERAYVEVAITPLGDVTWRVPDPLPVIRSPLPTLHGRLTRLATEQFGHELGRWRGVGYSAAACVWCGMRLAIDELTGVVLVGEATRRRCPLRAVRDRARCACGYRKRPRAPLCRACAKRLQAGLEARSAPEEAGPIPWGVSVVGELYGHGH